MKKPAISKQTTNLKRRVFVNIEPSNDYFEPSGAPKQFFVDNMTHTSKYNLLTFVPKTLFEQFRRVANMFFLTLVVLQCFPDFQIVSPIIAAGPLVIIVALTAAKDGVEDLRRHKTDEMVNHQTTLTINMLHNQNVPFMRNTSENAIYTFFKKLFKRSFKSRQSSISPEKRSSSLKRPTTSELTWTETFWKDVKIGDFVFLKNNETIPADIIVMSTSDQDCLCYVETKNLDGETNLKIKRGIVETAFIRSTGECAYFGCYIDAECPTPNLFNFSGSLNIPSDYIGYVADKSERFGIECEQVDIPNPAFKSEDDTDHRESFPLDHDILVNRNDNNGLQIPLNINNLLLRGCIVRNTDWVIGMVVATGSDTKIRLNSGKTPSKRSLIEKKMNPQIIVNLLLLTLMCIATSVASPLWESGFMGYTDFIESMFAENTSSAGAAAWIKLLLQSFCKSLITYQNVVPISLYLTVEIVKTIQAYFIYSDVDMYYEPLDAPCLPRSWNLADDLGQIEYIFSDKTGTLTRNIMHFKKCSINSIVYGDTADPSRSRKSVVSTNETMTPKFHDSLLNDHLTSLLDQQYVHVQKFFTALAVCHSVLVSKNDAVGLDLVEYKASSPDEAALVKGAKDVGFIFTGRDNENLLLNVQGKELSYRILNVIEFNSTRKRMSVIAKCPDGQIRVFCKGADSVIYERLGEGQDERKLSLTKHMDYFAEEVVLTAQEYEDWDLEYQAAAISLVDREAMIDAVAEKIEKNLNLLGATAIEDKLQEDVPEAIFTLRQAGIKIWVLTGDKVETAVNIGFSCNLLHRDMKLILLRTPNNNTGNINEKDDYTVREQIILAFEKFWGMRVKYNEKSVATLENIGQSAPVNSHGLIIDGSALKHATENKEDSHLFWLLATKCNVVLCCRVSPLQKAQVVELVKSTGKGAMCLAIGDGANDVGMIQAAHIGVGIAGEEGLQAVMASDYAIGQFKFLTKLLLVHGHWSYIKTSEMILCFFFKNIIYVMPLFWYQYLCGYSSEMVFEFSYMLLYNILFTSTPVIALGLFERDVSVEFAHLIPTIYTQGVKNEAFTLIRFTTFMMEGFYQSLVCFFLTIGVYNEAPVDSTAHGALKVELGTVMAVVTILNANWFVFARMHTKTIPGFLSILVPNLMVLIWTALYAIFPDSALQDIGQHLFATPTFYLLISISTVLCHFPRIVISFAMQLISPSDIQIIQEMEVSGHMRVMDDCAESYEYPNESLVKRISVGSIFVKTVSAQTEEGLISTIYVPAPSVEAVRPAALTNSGKGSNSNVSENAEVKASDDKRPNELKVHFESPKINVAANSPFLQRQSGSFTDDRKSQHSNLGDETRKCIHLNVMTKGLDFDQRGFSFSESPGVRDLILGRKDVRPSPIRLIDPTDTVHASLTPSTQSVPQTRQRPRANTFTYGKRARFSLSNVHSVEDHSSSNDVESL